MSQRDPVVSNWVRLENLFPNFCDFTEFSCVSSKGDIIAMALYYEPHLLRLSDDILLQIMSFLKLEDILTLAQ